MGLSISFTSDFASTVRDAVVDVRASEEMEVQFVSWELKLMEREKEAMLRALKKVAQKASKKASKSVQIDK